MSRKKKGRKAGREARGQAQHQHQALLGRALRSPLLDGMEVAVRKPGTVPTSEPLLAVAQPLLERSDDMEEARLAVQAAAMAWNLALEPQESREALIRQLAEEACYDDPRERSRAKRTLRMLVDRKLALFPDDGRVIVDFDLTETPEGMQVSVVSATLS